VNQFCPRCGAQFAPDVNMEFATTQVLCVECGLSMEDPPEMLPSSENDDDQIAYDLVEWPPEDRTIATADLVELGIPYRWEDNVVLVVPAGTEEQVDAILDEIDENALSEDEEFADDALLLDAEGEDGGEEAATAMSDLFIAADALQHGTYDEQRVVEFMEAAAAVEQCLPPYGIEPQVWSRVQKDASAIVAALEKGEDDESTAAAAQGLRNLLRQYV
jgi:Zn ribbon nucleic-acid-binding protein